MALPAIKNLRADLPEDSEIIVLAREPLASLCRDCSLGHRILSVDRNGRVEGDSPYLHRPDAYLLLTNTLRPAWHAWRSGAPIRIGAAKRYLVKLLLTHPVDLPFRLNATAAQAPSPPPGWSGATTVEGYNRLAKATLVALAANPRNSPSAEATNYLTPSAAAREQAAEWLTALGIEPRQTARPIIGFQAGAAYGTAKRWPPSALAQAITQIFDQNPNAVALGLGTAVERTDLVAVRQAVQTLNPAYGSRIIVPEKGLNLPAFVALLSLLDLVIANDSGPMHVAVAVGTPCVAVFGPTDWISTGYADGPKYKVIREPGIECSPCMKRHCPIDHRCMTRIEPNRVADAATSLLRPFSQ